MNLGIDLTKRGHEIRKLLLAGFGATIRNNGWDENDVLQNVFMRIIVSNAGASPFDPSRAGFGHYIHMICSSTIRNMWRAHVRQSKVGLLLTEDDPTIENEPDASPSAESEVVARDLRDRIAAQLSPRQRRVFEVMAVGDSVRDASVEDGHTASYYGAGTVPKVRRVAQRVAA